MDDGISLEQGSVSQTESSAGETASHEGGDIDTGAGSGQIFDISEDSIQPVSADEVAQEEIAQAAPMPASVSVPAPEPVKPTPVAAPAPEPIKIEEKPAPVPLPTSMPTSMAAAITAPITADIDAKPISKPAPVVNTAPAPAPAPTPAPMSAPTPAPIPDAKMRPSSDANDLGGVFYSPAAPQPVPPPRVAPANPPAKTLGNLGGDGIAAKIKVPENANIKNIRTFEGDIAEAMSHKNISTASIAIAESSKASPVQKISNVQQAPAAPSHAPRNIFFTLASLVLLLGGAGVAYYLYSQSPLYPSPQATPATNPQVPVHHALIPADVQTMINVDGLGQTAVLTKIQAEIGKSQPPNTLKEIIPISTKTGNALTVNASDMLSLMQIQAPDILTRSLDPSWMLGTFEDSNGVKSVFVVAETNFFQNAFAGMLQWESTITNDLKPYLYSPDALNQSATPPASAPVTTVSSTTSTTASSTAKKTPVLDLQPIMPSASTFTLRGHFEDRIIGNRDVREYITDGGNMLFLYSFTDNNHLVIAGSEGALSQIITRLEKQSFVR